MFHEVQKYPKPGKFRKTEKSTAVLVYKNTGEAVLFFF